VKQNLKGNPTQAQNFNELFKVLRWFIIELNEMNETDEIDQMDTQDLGVG